MADQLQPLSPPILDLNGQVVPGATVKFVRSGTNTAVDIFANATDTAPQLQNPLKADAYGRIPQVFFKAGYAVRAVVGDAAGVTIYEVDPCPRSTGSASAAADITFAPNENSEATNVQSAIDAISAKVSGFEQTGEVGGELVEAETQSAARTAINAMEALGAISAVRINLTTTSETIPVSAYPRKFSAILECLTADSGYAVGDKIVLPEASACVSSDNTGVTFSYDSENIYFRRGSAGVAVHHKTTGNRAILNNSSWRIEVTTQY